VPNTLLKSEDVMAHCQSTASFKRPQHVEIWPSDKQMPLTRSTKVDKLKLPGTGAFDYRTVKKSGEMGCGSGRMRGPAPSFPPLVTASAWFGAARMFPVEGSSWFYSEHLSK